jgi:lysozyme
MTLKERAKTLLRDHEGVRAKVYKDSLGIPTIGVGRNLQRLDSRESLKRVGADYDQLLLGKAALTDAQIDALLEEDIDACLADLRTLFDDFDERPVEIQLVLLDLRFNLGAKGLRGFPNTLKDISSGNYESAAARLEKSLWATQVKSRAVTICKMLRDAQTIS